MEGIKMEINEKGIEFYQKWLRETKSGLIFYAPVFLLFYLGLGVAIYGSNLMFALISILPTLLILGSFVYPYYSRKKYFNQMARSVSVNENIILIETLQWFSASAVIKSVPLNEIIINKEKDIAFFKERKVYSLKVSPDDNAPIYIIDEFFDDNTILLSYLK